MINKVISKVIILVLCVFLSSCATISDSANYYRDACQQAKNKNYDAAFMRLRAVLNDNPHSQYAPKAAFAIGEYYLERRDYLDAVVAFHQYIENYPSDSGVIFAETVIYKIATEVKSIKSIPIKGRDLLEGIRKRMFSKPVFFIFSEKKKSYSYRSLFGNVYVAFDYVDKVKIMRNDQLFLELSP